MRWFVLYILLGLSLSAEAQIKIKETATKPQQETTMKYDSTDVSMTYPERYINQRVIYYQKTALLYTKDYRSFGGQKEYEAPLFTYFTINSIKRNEVELKREDNGDICYYYHHGDGVKPIMAVGYYENYVRIMQGSLWCVDEYDGVFEIVDIWLREGGISQTLQSTTSDTTRFELKTMYGQKSYNRFLEYLDKFKGQKWVLDSDMTCGTVDTIIVKKGTPYITFNADNGKTYDYYIDYSKEDFTKIFNVLGLPKYTITDQERYIKKFGKHNWMNILSGTVKVGMTAEMVLICWGAPTNNVNITDQLGDYDTWIWEHLNKRVMFVNGKVHTITSY